MPIRRMLKRESSEAVKAIGREKQAQMHTLLRKLVLKVRAWGDTGRNL